MVIALGATPFDTMNCSSALIAAFAAVNCVSRPDLASSNGFEPVDHCRHLALEVGDVIPEPGVGAQVPQLAGVLRGHAEDQRAGVVELLAVLG